MNKILGIRIALALCLVGLSGCAADSYRNRATEGVGPFGANARNSLADKNPAGLVNVAEGFERSGNLTGAQNLYAQVISNNPDLINAQIGYARVTVSLGGTKQGLDLFARLHRDNPSNSKVIAEYARVHIRNDDFDAAANLLQPLLATGYVSNELLILGGKLAQVAGDISKARQLFEKAMSVAPGDHKATQYLALSFALSAEYPAAVALVQTSMARVSGQTTGQKILATIYALSGQLEAATLIARGAMSLDEANSRKLFYQLLPRLDTQAKAQAVMFDLVPKDAIRLISGGASK
ncbi:MAG: hypothetical protein JKY60_14065 [Kordiimonadaceae bacterium]|nr:hypothetical protein [Kordiimonadaceae bacterium]